MYSLKITAVSEDISTEKAWTLLTEIETYPKKIKFIKKVKVYGTGKGSRWDDLTTILWIPLLMHHTVTSFKQNAEYAFHIPLKTGGFMDHKYIITKNNQKGAKVDMIVTFDLGNKFLNITLGILLKQRLKDMLISSIMREGTGIIIK